jgi:hypothetical protein
MSVTSSLNVLVGGVMKMIGVDGPSSLLQAFRFITPHASGRLAGCAKFLVQQPSSTVRPDGPCTLRNLG